ncbi:MAG: SDR family oxidoreductase, partial [Planctomycetaceae bacterium]|nr:SDR family oxidoreductase [Planctomycetaceae bacterium]
MSYLLMTGATGLVGRHVLRNLLESQVRVAVLVRDGKTVRA